MSGALMFSSSYDDSPSYDEVENISAGYYYVTAQSYWINHYQPPLVKDFSGWAVATTNPKSHIERSEWSHFRKSICDVFFWGQSDSQNMLRVARIPSIVFAIVFLAYYFKRIEREFSNTAGLIAVTMLGMSPTFLTHARFATTDVPSACCFFISLFTFFDYLRKPSMRSLTVLAVVTGLALLVKFSLPFLFPVYFILLLLWSLSRNPVNREPMKQLAVRLFTNTSYFVFIVATIVWLGYYVNMIHMTPHFQQWWVHKHFKYFLADPRVELISLTGEIPILRPFSWYLTGLFGQYINVREGPFSFSYLQGALYKGGNLWYFPYLLVLKEPIGFTALFIITLFTMFSTAAKRSSEYLKSIFKTSDSVVRLATSEPERNVLKHSSMNRLETFIQANFVVIGSTIFAVLYLSVAMRSNLNIGVRHILPVIPFMYMLTAVGIARLFSLPGNSTSDRRFWSKKILRSILSALLLYGCVSSLLAFPGYLSYYNELAGGKTHGINIAIDSNFDWGTDLYRLKKYVDDNKIDRIHVLYFGKGNPEYYLGKQVKRWNQKDILPPDEYLAVSAHFVAQAAALRSLSDEPKSFKDASFRTTPFGMSLQDKKVLEWFCSLEPIGTAGDSILIYKTP